MKQKKLVTAIKRIVGAELLLSAALSPLAQAQSAASTDTGLAGTTSTTSAASPATSASTPAVSQLQRVEVTGSLIRTADKVGNTEVQTVTARQIQESGYTTVADFLRGVSANSGSSWSQATASTTAPGGAGIALRGLSEKYTLVLVDGQRVTNYAKAVNFTDTFFDVNSIPMNMVDRIEIVKTGAVSQYGSDAIAGVVNIITKKNFQGLQIDGQLGKAQHPGDGQGNFSVLAGKGNVNTDGWNVTAAASWYRDSGSTLADRDMTANSDFSNYAGGTNQPSNQKQQYWTLADGTTAPASNCVGGSTTLTGGSSCSYKTSQDTSLNPAITRLNAKMRATFRLDDTTQAYVDLWGSRNETYQMSGIASLTSLTNVYDPTTGTVSRISRLVPASNPYNPYGTATTLNYAFPNATTSNDTVSTYWKASTGVKGSYSIPKAGDWDWNIDAGHSQSTVDTTYTNVFNVAAVNNIINNGVLDFANPSLTPNGEKGLFQNDYQQAISKTDSVSATTSTGNLFHLPTGDIGLGFGTEFRHESSVINPQTYSSLGITAPANVQSVQGSRNVAAVYYQMQIPLLHNLVFTQAGRYDHYSDFGGAFSPSFALRYQPVQAFTTYASFSRGFRAPTLVENSQATYIGHQTLLDPYAPGGSTKAFTTEDTVGNKNLQPEHTKNYNLGFELSPDRSTDFGAAFYKVHIGGVIGTADPQALIDANNPEYVVRNAAGSIVYINQEFVNLGSLDTDGFDLNFRKTVGTPVGNFTLAADWAYVWHFKLHNTDGTSVDFAGNNLALNQPFGASNPRWKGNTTLTWGYQAFTTTLTWQYTGGYTNAVAVQNEDGGNYQVASYSQFNLFTAYRGFKNWTIYGGISNLFDKRPPFDIEWEGYPEYTGYDQSLYTYIGRTFQVGATYRF
ncbi:MAG: TonB-dependent receptor [Janthinobacterium lividum]